MLMKPLATIRINIETRNDGTVYISSNDGTVYISSDDMPGLWLWGKNPEQVFGSIIPTIEELYKHSQGQPVKVQAAPPSRFARWFAQEKINDRYEIYPAAKLNEHTLHGR